MFFSNSHLLSLAACCGVLNAAAIVERVACNADNCLRALDNYASASAFCAAYTTATSTATTGLPSFASQCTGSTVSRISSACSCYTAVPATSTSTKSTTSATCATVTATATLPASTVTLPPNTVTLPPDTVTLPPSTVTLPPDTVTLPPDTVTLPPDTVTLPPNTVTLPASTVTLPPSTVTLPGTTVKAPPGYSLGFGLDPLIDFVEDNVVEFAAVQDPANAYAGQSYLLIKFDPTINSGDATPQVTVNVQPNTNYIADGYFKMGIASGTCEVAIAVLNQAGNAYLNTGSGGTYYIHPLSTTYSYDSTAFNTGANTQVSVRYITSCYNANGDSVYFDNLTLHAA